MFLVCERHRQQTTIRQRYLLLLMDEGLSDVWKMLRSTNEKYNDVSYRNNDVTWDSANNTKIKHPEYREFHRPDRIFLRCPPKLVYKGRMEPISIKRIVNTLSDHYGLVMDAKFVK